MTNVPECVYAMPGTLPTTVDTFNTRNHTNDKSPTTAAADTSLPVSAPPTVQSAGKNNNFTVFRL
jgi:hypothetical protein